MAGIIKVGTSVQPVQLAAAADKTWQHNRGVNPLRVEVIDTSNNQVSANVKVEFLDVNSIKLTNAGGLVSTTVFVDWDVTSQDACSLNGAYGVVPPTYGFVG